ncbi:hypothetical protein [uncultured Prevotella sp.]|uniref:hypothetical protein n=1 Tax=uncultured Prevotella sp. TaxID=159272 RepID=UPI0025ED9529|nr:hypothetical protein [uncultured Prevotella sp.]
MPLTKEQLAKIAQKEATLSAALKRSTSINYYEGYFFITLNTRDYAPILSYISGRPDAPEGAPDAPRCEYTELGRKVMAVWQTVPRFHPQVEIIAAEAMPDHFHGLLRLKAGNRKHLGRIVNGFMIACTHEYWDTVGIKWRDMKKDPNKSDRDASRDWYDRDHTRSFRGPSLFVRGYNDMEAVTPEQVQTKLQYIREQARRALIKGTLRDRFHIHRSCKARGWTLDAIRRGLRADRFYAHNPERLEATLRTLMPHINMQPAATALAPAALSSGSSPASAPKPLLSYIGCSALLSAERKLPLVCHRSDAPFFERQRDAVLRAAREGYVIVSAFISPKEREIRRLLLMEQLPVIEVYDNGLADRYKPSGKNFYACAENRLVQISPWNYEYCRNMTVNREVCLVMNEMARVIAGTGEGWWKEE